MTLYLREENEQIFSDYLAAGRRTDPSLIRKRLLPAAAACCQESQIKLQMRMGPTLQSADSMKHSFWEDHTLSTSQKIPIIP